MGTPRSNSDTSRCAALAGTCGGLCICEVVATLCFTWHKKAAAIFFSSPIICGTKKKRKLHQCYNMCIFFSGKVILAAGNRRSKITLLTLRISYVFSSLSSLNLPLSCPELSVASRARTSEVFKVDVWGRNRANVDVAHGSLPSASFSPQACGACQLPLVSNSLTKPTPTRLHHSLLWGSRCVITQLSYT